MKSIFVFSIIIFLTACHAFNAENTASSNTVTWEQGMDVEVFWSDYATSKGGLTWGESDTYPEYNKVKEGDTFLVQLKQGPCLMEFFHNRWRRANDVRRWDDSMNTYGGCPHVFD